MKQHNVILYNNKNHSNTLSNKRNYCVTEVQYWFHVLT